MRLLKIGSLVFLGLCMQYCTSSLEVHNAKTHIKNNVLSSKSIVDDMELVKYLARKLQAGDHKGVENYLSLIYNTRKDKSAQAITAAANAITILAAAEHSFYKYDLSGICIKGANVRNGIFGCANFKKADVTDVNFTNANLCKADFTDAIMEGIKLSIYPDLEMRTFLGFINPIYRVVASPIDDRVATIARDGIIRIWDFKTSEEIARFMPECEKNLQKDKKRGNCIFTDLLYSPDGNYVILREKINEIAICDIHSGKREYMEIDIIESNDPIITDFSHLSTVVFCNTNSITVIIPYLDWSSLLTYNLKTQKLESKFIYNNIIRSLLCPLDAKQSVILPYKHNNVFEIWNAITNEIEESIILEDDSISSADCSQNGCFLALGTDKGKINIWRLNDLKKYLNFDTHYKKITRLAYSSDSKYLVSTDEDFLIKIWDAMVGQEIQTCVGHTAKVSSITWCRDSKFFVSGSVNTELKVWQLDTSKKLQDCMPASKFYDYLKKTYTNLHTNSDTSVIKAFYDKKNSKIEVLNLSTKETVLEKKDIYNLKCFACSSDGEYLAYATEDENKNYQLQILENAILTDDISEDEEIENIKRDFKIDKDELKNLKIPYNKNAITCISFSPDNLWICLGFADGKLKSWEHYTDSEKLYIPDSSVFKLSIDVGITCQSYSKLGDKIISAAKNYKLTIWDVPSCMVLRTLTGHADIINCIINLDDNLIATASDDATIKIWNHEMEENAFNELVAYKVRIEDLLFKEPNILLVKYLGDLIVLWICSKNGWMLWGEGSPEESPLATYNLKITGAINLPDICKKIFHQRGVSVKKTKNKTINTYSNYENDLLIYRQNVEASMVNSLFLHNIQKQTYLEGSGSCSIY